jgi:hypothetical protein
MLYWADERDIGLDQTNSKIRSIILMYRKICNYHFYNSLTYIYKTLIIIIIMNFLNITLIKAYTITNKSIIDNFNEK